MANPGRRLPGRIALYTLGRTGRVTNPGQRLFRFGDQWALFVMANNKAKRRAVKVGQRNGLSAQILEGLAEGDAVITHPDDTIEDGVGVKWR